MSFLSVRKTIRSILLPVAFSGIGMAIAFLLKKYSGLDLSKETLSLVALLVTSFSVLLFFPRIFGSPFGKISVKDFLKHLNLFPPSKPVQFIALGIIAAAFTLSGMLVGTILTGKYIFDPSNITIGQALFSLTPGIWEEVLFRGVLMIVLIKLTGSLKKAAVIQILIFAAAHIKGLDLLSLVDAFSVGIIAIAFTYLAVRTRSLLPGIIFHYLHNTFLFAVQLPDGEYSGFHDNALFYAGLFIAVALIVIITKKLTRLPVFVNDHDIYPEAPVSIKDNLSEKQKKHIKKQTSKRMLFINTLGFSIIIFLGKEDFNPIVLALLGIYVLINVLMFIFWERLGDSTDHQVHLLNAFMAGVSSYDSFSNGSKHVYIIFAGISIVFLIMAYVSFRKYKTRQLIKECE